MPATARWEKPQGKRPAAGDGEDVHRGTTGDRAGDRLQHLPDLELVPGAVRVAGHRQRGRGEAASGARSCRWRSPCRSPVTCWPRPASAESGHPGRGEPGRDGRVRAGGAAGGANRRLHRVDRVRAAGWRSTPDRPRSTPRRPASTRCVVDSTDDYAGMLANLAFSLCLYSGQMCTTPQDLLVPADGVGTPRAASRWTSSRPISARRWRSCSVPDAQAVELLGAIVNDGVLSRVDGAGDARHGRHPVPDD